MPERPQFELERDAQKRVARDLLAQKTASSRPGQVYHTMTSLQDRMARPGYTPAQADTDQLKAIRRDWNRNQKYTPQGMRVSGVTTPMGAQDAFRRDTEVFRQANPQAYGTMYPLSQAAMKLGEYGGLLGLGVRALTGKLGDYYKDIMNKDGINAALDTNESELENYANLTYGPNMYDVAGPWFGTAPIEDVEISDLPSSPLRGVDVVDDIIETDLMPGKKPERSRYPKTYQRELEEWRRSQEPQVIPGYTTSYVDDFANLPDDMQEPPPPIVPFDDSGREAGIASLYGQGPMWGETNRRYEDDYRDYVERLGDMPGGPMTYEEFVDEWEGIQQGKPHAGLR
tara:strand:+ start:88 stop:1113 length:1026 start_codon:yes stop_codon:yes gene_type:complete